VAETNLAVIITSVILTITDVKTIFAGNAVTPVKSVVRIIIVTTLTIVEAMVFAHK